MVSFPPLNSNIQPSSSTICFCKTCFSKQKHENQYFRASLEPQASGPPLCPRAPNSIQDSLNESSVRPNGTPVMPILRSRKTQFLFSSFLFDFSAFWFEEITTGKTGNTHCLRSGHKINWFLASETLPVFPVVIFRH